MQTDTGERERKGGREREKEKEREDGDGVERPAETFVKEQRHYELSTDRLKRIQAIVYNGSLD